MNVKVMNVGSSEVNPKIMHDRNARMRKRPPEYWAELRRREGTLKMQGILLLKLAVYENGSTGIGQEEGYKLIDLKQRPKCAKSLQAGSVLEPDAVSFAKLSTDIVEAIRMLQ
jgi:hypothetical protein